MRKILLTFFHSLPLTIDMPLPSLNFHRYGQEEVEQRTAPEKSEI